MRAILRHWLSFSAANSVRQFRALVLPKMVVLPKHLAFQMTLAEVYCSIVSRRVRKGDEEKAIRRSASFSFSVLAVPLGVSRASFALPGAATGLVKSLP